MENATANSELLRERWIRPQRDAADSLDELPPHVVGELQELLSGRTRRRIAELLELERRKMTQVRRKEVLDRNRTYLIR